MDSRRVEPFVLLLQEGKVEEGWNLFLTAYSSVILTTIRSRTSDHDHAMDCYTQVLEHLHERDCARLKRFRGEAKVSTWLHTMIQRLLIDAHRTRAGRPRSVPLRGLSAMGQEIWSMLMRRSVTPWEVYERLRLADRWESLSYGLFLREWRSVLSAARKAGRHLAVEQGWPQEISIDEPSTDKAPVACKRTDPLTDLILVEQNAIVRCAWAGLPARVQRTVRLYLLEGRGAERVALEMGWPDARSVYRQVERAMKLMAASLRRAGMGEAR